MTARRINVVLALLALALIVVVYARPTNEFHLEVGIDGDKYQAILKQKRNGEIIAVCQTRNSGEHSILLGSAPDLEWRAPDVTLDLSPGHNHVEYWLGKRCVARFHVFNYSFDTHVNGK